MAVVVETFSDAVESVGDAVGAVGNAIEDVAQEVGNVVEDTAQSLGNTAQAIIDDPTKALPMIAVAVAAPYAAPYLWAGATTAQAAMVLNTGLALAQGADPVDVASNFAINFATQGLTSELGLTTGTDFVDTGINKAISTAVKTGDVSKGLASGIVSGGMSAAKNLDFTEGPEELGYTPEQLADITSSSTDPVTASQIFKDAVESGFTPDEAYAIAQGQMDAEQSGVSPYAPTASRDSNVLVTAAPPEFENAEPIELAPEEEKSPLDTLAMYGDFNLTGDETGGGSFVADNALATSETPGALDLVGELPPEMIPSNIPESPGVSLEEAQGNLPDAYGMPQYPGDSQYEEQDLQEQARDADSWDDGDPSVSPEVKAALSAASKARQMYKLLAGLTGKPGTNIINRNPLDLSGTTTGSTEMTQRSPLDLTAEITKGNTDFSLLPETTTNAATPAAPVAAQPSYAPAQYGFAIPFASGGRLGYGAQTGNYAAPSYTDRFDLSPVITRGNTNFRLPGYEKTRIFAAGGEVSNHHPEFYSEGGLNSLENRYVKGDGDGTSDDVPAMLANGEFVIPADVVSKLGNGSNDAGADVLDEFLQVIRKHAQNHDPKKLPPDSKGALAYLKEAQQRAKA